MARDARREVSSTAGSVRKQMDKQERGGGNFGVDIPQDKRITLKEQRGGVCLKKFDFLPYITSNNPDVKPGEIAVIRRYAIHRNLGVDGKSTVLCLKETYGKPCPVCEYQAELHRNAKTADEKKVAGALYRKMRELYNVIDLDDEKAGVKVFDASSHLFGKHLKTELDTAPDYKFDTFADIKGGWTVAVRFKKESMGENEFFEANRIDFEERDDFNADIIDETIDLDTLLKPKTYDEIKAILFGEDVEGDQVEEAPTREVSRRRAEPAEEAPTRRSRRTETVPTEPVEEEAIPEEKSTKEAFDKKDEAPAPEKKLERTRRAEPKEEPKAESSGDACKHGHKFGIDTDAFDECAKCKEWDDCGKAYDERKKNGK